MSEVISPAISPVAGAGCSPRRIPVPQCEPPYDDELPAAKPSVALPAGGVQGSLALAFSLPSGVPAQPEPLPGLRLVPVERTDEDGDEREDPLVAPQPTPRRLLPAPGRWSARLAQAMLEVLAGERPPTQLLRWTSEPVYADIDSRARRLVRPCPGTAQALAVRDRAVVRSVHVSEPADGVAEVCALVQRGARATALALRLEGVDGRWLCTALVLG
ncbi:MAG: hypothetical protein H0W56_09885 [Acidothermales bacterium]|nr:hypothetical protein [Acidothermales bacterium]